MLMVSGTRCVGCGLCVETCPQGAIAMADEYARIDNQLCVNCQLCVRQCHQKAINYIDSKPYKVAFGTDDGELLKTHHHVGMSKYFAVYEFVDTQPKFLEQRENVKYQEDESKIHGDPNKAKAVSGALKDIDVIVGCRFGPNITRLKNKFVCAVVRDDTIEQGLRTVAENFADIVEQENSPDKKGIVLF